MKRNLTNKRNLGSVVNMIGKLRLENPNDPVYADLYEKISKIEV
jgi:hypothetical protein